MKKYIYWFLTIFLMSSSMIYAQSTVSGKVSDSSNNPIINAIVEIQGSANSEKLQAMEVLKLLQKKTMVFL